MKILICTGIYPPDIGGPATYSKLLFDELPQKGVAVEVLSFGEVRHLPKLFRHFSYFLKTLKRGKKVDLIYAQDPVSVGLPSLLASKILRKKFVLKMVGDYAWEQFQQSRALLEFSSINDQFSNTDEQQFITPDEFQNQKSNIKNQKEEAYFISPDEFQIGRYDIITELRRKIERFVGKSADKVVVPSEYLKKIVTMWGVNPEKIKIVYNSFEPKTVAGTREDARNSLNLNDFVILSAGRLVPWKGFEMLIEVIKDLNGASLIIAGDGPDKNKLAKKIVDLNLQDKVKLLGGIEQSKLFEHIKASDLFVLNTGYEGLSHQLLEVMGIGTPIVTTDVCGNPELVQNGENGLLVSYNDKEALKKAIVRIMEDKDLSQKIVAKSKEKVLFFSKQKMLGETADVLKNTL